MTARRAWASAGLALAAACGGGDRPRDAATPAAAATDSSSAAAGPAIASAPKATVDAKGCVHDGRWRPCGFVDRLERAGLVVKALPDTVRYDFFAVPGVRYTLGRGEAQAFFYEDTTALARDVAALDTVLVSPKGSARHWDAHPWFVRSGNLAVVVLTGNDHLVERVQLAVEAGAPQPEPDLPPTAQPLPAAKVP